MGSQGRPGVLFDVDGTLVDSNYLHTLAWSRALRDVGEWAPMNAIHRLVGMGGDNLIPELLGHECPEAEKVRSERYHDLLGEVRAFPGAKRLVATVHQRGLATALATSSPSEELASILKILDVDEFLDAKTTADDISSSKPDPEVFLKAMEAASMDPSRTLAIGDSVWDVRAALAAGIGCVAVESGGSSRSELRGAGALHVYRDVNELRLHFESSPLAALCS